MFDTAVSEKYTEPELEGLNARTCLAASLVLLVVCLPCAMVDAEDYNIGRVLQALEEEGMTQNTLVMFFSDNGGPTNFGAQNFPLRGAKGSTREGGTRVPAVMKWPGHLKPGTKTSQVMQAIDVFPT